MIGRIKQPMMASFYSFYFFIEALYHARQAIAILLERERGSRCDQEIAYCMIVIVVRHQRSLATLKFAIREARNARARGHLRRTFI